MCFSKAWKSSPLMRCVCINIWNEIEEKKIVKMSPRVTLCQASLGTINKIAIECTKIVNALRDTTASPWEECVFFKNYLFRWAMENETWLFYKN